MGYKDIYIWGAGRYGYACHEFLKMNGLYAKAIIDSNVKDTNRIDSVPVFAPHQFFSDHSNEIDKLIIIIAVKNHVDDIREQINEILENAEIEVISYETAIEMIASKTKKGFVADNKRKVSECLSVLYDYQIFYAQEYGGISRYFCEIISRMLRENDIAISLFEGLFRCRYDLQSEVERYGEYYGESVDKYEDSMSALIPTINNIFLKEFIKGKKYNIYHPTYYENMKLSCYDNMVLTVHDLIYEIYAIDPDFCKIMRSTIKKADYIVAVSQHTKSDLINFYGIDENRIRVIYHGNSLKIEVTDDRVVKEPYFLYVGRRDGYKNASSLMKAFAHLKCKDDFKLVFFGGGSFSLEEKQMLKDLRIEQYVYQTNGDDKLLANLYKYAEAFIYPSKYEGFGIPILEAMHYGTPVITSNVSSMPEVAGEAALYVNPDDMESIMYAMNKLTLDSDLRRTLGQKGIEREKLFSWEKATAQLHDYYVEISS